MLNEKDASLKKANKKICNHNKELKELSTSVTQDIEDSRALKSLGMAWVNLEFSSVGTDIKEIRVCGAGIKGVDGVYIFAEVDSKGYPKYHKGALIGGKKKVFQICVTNTKGSEKLRWWIADGKQTKWYHWAKFTPGSNGGAPVPPANVQWSKATSGKEPNPFVTTPLRSTD